MQQWQALNGAPLAIGDRVQVGTTGQAWTGRITGADDDVTGLPLVKPDSDRSGGYEIPVRCSRILLKL